MPISLISPLDPEGIERIHAASMAVLARTGIRFQSETALAAFKHHGFRVDGEIAFLSERQVWDALATVPREITIMARNPDYNLVLSAETAAFGLGRGAVTFVDPDGSFRRGSAADFIDTAKLAQQMALIQHWEPLIHPGDIPPANAELWATKTMLEYLDKPYNYHSARHIELVALAFGMTPREMAEKARGGLSFGQGTVTTLSPLTLSAHDLRQLFAYVAHGIAFHIAAMPLAGTTGPCTFAGLLVQQNCENLAPLVLSQLLRPGTPVFYGSIASHADMVGMGPVFGSAEARKFEYAGGQLARHYGLLCRGNAGLTDSLGEDFQAGAEALLHILNVLGGSLNFLPGMGLLGSYLGASLAKVVLDAELIGYARRYLTPIPVDEDHLALEVIQAVGPGGEYITHDHTLAHCRTEFTVSRIFNRQSYGDGSHHRSQGIIQVAHAKARAIIAEYRRPPLAPEIAKALDAYVQTHSS
ncbi:MAG: trimethylamine methyltransferase family protein [Desulfobacterales bacterium]